MEFARNRGVAAVLLVVVGPKKHLMQYRGVGIVDGC